LFVNGQLVASQSGKLTTIQGIRPIGNLGRGYNDDTFFAGDIAEVLVYDGRCRRPSAASSTSTSSPSTSVSRARHPRSNGVVRVATEPSSSVGHNTRRAGHAFRAPPPERLVSPGALERVFFWPGRCGPEPSSLGARDWTVRRVGWAALARKGMCGGEGDEEEVCGTERSYRPWWARWLTLGRPHERDCVACRLPCSPVRRRRRTHR
jgi:hypothetical protein